MRSRECERRQGGRHKEGGRQHVGGRETGGEKKSHIFSNEAIVSAFLYRRTHRRVRSVVVFHSGCFSVAKRLIGLQTLPDDGREDLRRQSSERGPNSSILVCRGTVVLCL